MKITKKIFKLTKNDDGTTLLELILTMVLTLVVVSVVPPLLSATTTAASTSQQISYGTNSVQIAIQQIDNYVASASKVCVASKPLTFNNGSTATTYTTNSGYALAVESDAFNGPGAPEWVEWIIPTTSQGQPSTLYTRTWPASATNSGSIEFTPLAGPIYNSNQTSSSSLPFSVASSGPPEELAVNLWVGSSTHIGATGANPTVHMTNSIVALNTGFSASNSGQSTSNSTTGEPSMCT
jgi:hypothetical protein